ncbi:MAG: hypothetical protein K0S14_2467 [Thermomicrobiales bacterium]|nr:hypothetical protein [Thermomicrobiales bacterium]
MLRFPVPEKFNTFNTFTTFAIFANVNPARESPTPIPRHAPRLRSTSERAVSSPWPSPSGEAGASSPLSQRTGPGTLWLAVGG